MSKYITVIITNRDGKAQSGVKVSTMSSETRTDNNGQATICVSGSSITIFVNGRTVYDGFASSCPNQIFHTI